MNVSNPAPNAKKALLITDCDEVLLHMVSPFREWLDEEKAIDFNFAGGDFAKALIDRDSGETVEQARIWALLNEFFDGQMARQYPIAGAVQSVLAIAEIANVVVLTNLLDHRRESRAAQLQAVGLNFPVICNQGGKGEPLKKIIDEYQPDIAVFIDDLPQHHESAARHAPDCWRLHLIGEAAIAPHIACAETAGHAHARIDNWDEALPWIMDKIEAAAPAPEIAVPA